MSLKEVPRFLAAEGLAGRKISNAQGPRPVHVTSRRFQRMKVPSAAEGPLLLLHRLRVPAGAPTAAAGRRVRSRGRAAPEHLPGFNTAMHPRSCRGRGARCLSRPSLLRAACAHPRAGPPHGQAAGSHVPPALCPRPQHAPSCNSTPVPTRLETRGPQLGAARASPDSNPWSVLLCRFRPSEDLHGYVTLLRPARHTHLPACPWPCRHRLNFFVRNDPHLTSRNRWLRLQDPSTSGPPPAEHGRSV